MSKMTNSFTFTLRVTNPCATTTLSSFTMADLHAFVDGPPAERLLPEVSAALGICGSVAFQIVDAAAY